MKKNSTILLIILVLLFIPILYSCNNDNDNEYSNNRIYKNEITSFKIQKNLSLLKSNKLIDSSSFREKFYNNYTFISEIKGKDVRIEKIFKGITLIVSNDYKKLFAFSDENKNIIYEFDLKFDKEKKMYRPIFINRHFNNKSKNIQERGRWGCALMCGVEAAMIAASDGPSPAMDIIAIGYAWGCGSQC